MDIEENKKFLEDKLKEYKDLNTYNSTSDFVDFSKDIEGFKSVITQIEELTKENESLEESKKRAMNKALNLQREKVKLKKENERLIER